MSEEQTAAVVEWAKAPLVDPSVGWVSMQDKSPEKLGRYLTFVQNTEEVVVEWLGNGWAFQMPVTHWRELPPRP